MSDTDTEHAESASPASPAPVEAPAPEAPHAEAPSHESAEHAAAIEVVEAAHGEAANDAAAEAAVEEPAHEPIITFERQKGAFRFFLDGAPSMFVARLNPIIEQREHPLAKWELFHDGYDRILRRSISLLKMKRDNAALISGLEPVPPIPVPEAPEAPSEPSTDLHVEEHTEHTAEHSA